MKTKILALSIALAIGATSQVASAALQNSLNVGIKGGFVRSDLSSTGNVNFHDDDRNGSVYGAYATYNVTPWFGVEAGYNFFNGFSMSNGTTSYDYDLHGPEAGVRFAVPFDAKGSDVYARAGGSWLKSHSPAFDGGTENFAPYMGVGVQYAIDQNFGVRAGVDYYFNGLDSSDRLSGGKVQSDLTVASVGFQYTFGGDSQPVVASKQVEKKHLLQAGTLFPFDGSTVSAQGKSEIKNIVKDAQNIQQATYEVSGYTDRIGSEQYNQRLSEKRANAVANELKANGVPAQSTVVKGYGEQNSITGDKCNSLKGNELIKCLSPDRRVEVVVRGTSVE